MKGESFIFISFTITVWLYIGQSYNDLYYCLLALLLNCNTKVQKYSIVWFGSATEDLKFPHSDSESLQLLEIS